MENKEINSVELGEVIHTTDPKGHEQNVSDVTVACVACCCCSASSVTTEEE